ncbi:MAG: hypothetical protein IKH46_05960 [Lachnospiraceae bacterium]|nr:hypothetical protein [Lachnospiraceae bacterium]
MGKRSGLPDVTRIVPLAWIYWHTHDYEKGRQHVDALPTIRNNMLQETLLPYYISATTDSGIVTTGTVLWLVLSQ